MVVGANSKLNANRLAPEGLRMSVATLTLNEWESSYYEAMALIAKFKAAVERQVGIFGIATRLWRLNHTLGPWVTTMEGLCQVEESSLPAFATRDLVEHLRKLQESLRELVKTLRARGFANRNLTGAAVHQLAKVDERLYEVVDSLDLIAERKFYLQHAQEAIEQISKGVRTVPAHEVFHDHSA